MAVFKKGDSIRNKYNGLTYIITDVLTVSYEIKSETCQKWLLPFEDEGEWELISDKNMENIIMDKFSEKIARHFSSLYNVSKNIDAQIKKQNDSIKSLNEALYDMEHNIISAAESLCISQEEHDKIIDECLYGKEPELNELPKETLDDFAYQVAYDLSNDWMKETPDWNDVETSCKLGAKMLFEKTCEFLKSYRQDTLDGTGYIPGIVNDKTIADYKKFITSIK